MTTRVWPIVFLLCVGTAPSRVSEGNEEGGVGSEESREKPDGSRSKTDARRTKENQERDEARERRLIARWSGVEIHYEAVTLPSRSRSALRERKGLLAFTAQLKTKVPLAYRRKRAEPGAYRLRLEGKVKGEWHMLLERWVQTGGKPKKSPRPADATKPSGRRRGQASATGGSSPERKQEKGKAKGSEVPAPVLRVPLKIVTLDERNERLQVLLKPSARGKRLQIALRFGRCQAHASLRVEDVDGPRSSRKKKK